MKKLATLIGGTLVAASVMASPSYAGHVGCDKIGEELVRVATAEHQNGENVHEKYAPYGNPGQVGPDKYNTCVIESFNKNIGEDFPYTLEVRKNDPRYRNGTTYTVIKKN